MSTSTHPASSFTERIVVRAGDLVSGGGLSRRSFLYRAAVVATALAVNPLRYILRPGTAYASVCGSDASCSSGWTAFCCTIADGANTCPPGSYAAGWWKVDNSSFCRGGARYYIDCNRTPDATCSCHCADGECDRRRVCCNVFRYGQCNQHVAGVTEVVCRVVTCMAPWEWDPSCTTTVRTSPATADHNATCLPGEWPSHIEVRYLDMGMAGSVLGRLTKDEADAARGGRWAGYEHGFIFWREPLGAHAVHGPIAERYDTEGRESGPLGYPTSDVRDVGDRRGRWARFEHGAIYVTDGTGAYALHGAVLTRYRRDDGPRGWLGYPTSSVEGVADGRGQVARFEGGVIYWGETTGAWALHGGILERYRQEGGPAGALGLPTSDVRSVFAGVQRASFEGGVIEHEPTTGLTRVIRRREQRDARPQPSGGGSRRETRRPGEL